MRKRSVALARPESGGGASTRAAFLRCVSRLKITIAAIALAGVIAAAMFLPVGTAIGHAVRFIHDLGPLGLVLYSVLFVGSALLLVPTTPVFLGAGLLYGLGGGTLLLTVLSVVTELVTFVLVRSHARPWIEERLQHHEKLAAVDDAVAQHSLVLGSLLRLSLFVPYGPLNYALAVSKMPLWQHVITNVLGMTPCNLLMAYAGSLISDATRLGDTELPGVWKHVALWGGLAVTIAASAVIGLATKRAHERARARAT
jgi:uncharacterized membrane protein YdjX (TVP38/TMEM64 family)